jgi:hypothetical protein
MLTLTPASPSRTPAGEVLEKCEVGEEEVESFTSASGSGGNADRTLAANGAKKLPNPRPLSPRPLHAHTSIEACRLLDKARPTGAGSLGAPQSSTLTVSGTSTSSSSSSSSSSSNETAGGHAPVSVSVSEFKTHAHGSGSGVTLTGAATPRKRSLSVCASPAKNNYQKVPSLLHFTRIHL